MGFFKPSPAIRMTDTNPTIPSSMSKKTNKERNFYKVVLTGGPCAGKTSSLAIISDHFRNLGWHVYTCPEATTLLVSGGVSWAALNETQWFNFQLKVMRTMMQIEDTYATCNAK